MSDISDVVNVQRDKSPEVVSKTADVLGRNGLGKESILPAGRQSRPSSICLCYVVQWSLLSHSAWADQVACGNCIPYLVCDNG